MAEIPLMNCPCGFKYPQPQTKLEAGDRDIVCAKWCHKPWDIVGSPAQYALMYGEKRLEIASAPQPYAGEGPLSQTA